MKSKLESTNAITYDEKLTMLKRNLRRLGDIRRDLEKRESSITTLLLDPGIDDIQRRITDLERDVKAMTR